MKKNRNRKRMQTAGQQDGFRPVPIDALDKPEQKDLPDVVETHVADTVTPEGIRVVPYYEQNELDMMIPDSERAVDDGGEADGRLDQVWEKVSPHIHGMSHIEGVLNNCIYAKVVENAKGMRTIEFCQAYRNGKFSPLIRIEQSDVLGFLQEIQCTKDKKQTPAERRLQKEYLGKFSGDPDELLNVREIMKAFLETLSTLSSYSDRHPEQERRSFYRDVVELVKGLQSQAFIRCRSYYPLTEDDIEYLAHDLKMSRIELLRKLDSEGFLYRTPSCSGYQANVRIPYMDGSSYTERRYCIRNLDFFAGTDTDADTDNDTDESFRNF